MAEDKNKIQLHRQAGKILVLGASGYVGCHLVSKLVKEGYVVRAASRDLTRLKVKQWHGVELVQCDLLELRSLTEVLDGVSHVFYLVHSMESGGNYAERDQQAAINFAAAVSQSQVQHIIYLGSLTSTGTQSKHLLSREKTGELLRSSNVCVSELRAPIIIGAGSVPFEVIRDIVNHMPVMLLPRQMTSRSAPIALENLLNYLTGVLMEPSLHGQKLDISGPEIISYAQLMTRYGQASNKPFRYLITSIIPIWLIRLCIPIFSPAPKEITKALLGGVNHDIEAEPSTIRTAIPQHLLSIEQAIKSTNLSEHAQQDALEWSHGNMIFRFHNNQNSFYGERIIVSHHLDVEPENVWRVLATIGGEHGYFYLDILWRIRGWIDALIGGPGFVRHRDNPTELFSGEKIDTWIIMEAKKHQRLLLKFIMRSPGAGCLEFKIKRLSPSKTQLSITAYMHPKGLWGRLYWVLFKPAHLLIFHGMSKRILKLAKQNSANNTK